ncbi:Co2+/Mg2+ efflux protein ApaG [Mesorhizobium sp. RP14(2022)]|jgi:ApaG protein|uniref:Protein ApaG n=1 Tax=Mesorhizobium liriopis TaxID=2953882 RepID=A0ABT1C0G6_9HYPH|nr:Co2+/Mg2+ efflux protein ApaG [Mesorhizobium liriopis]MCO6048329.1 Co2+/Mg2+ efflux protein ApaG [Mesorhizobium liriopis]
MYRAVTRNLVVEVEPSFLPDQSDAEDSHYVWAYRVTVANESEETVQLVSRYWRIVDATGHVEEVRGPGVVGEQPTLSPGDSFQYSSGCPLSTPSGFMEGRYSMVSETGEKFDIAIPAFSLDLPNVKRSVN